MPCKGRPGSVRGVWRLWRRWPEARRHRPLNDAVTEASRLGSTVAGCSGQYEDNITKIDASRFWRQSFAGALRDPGHPS